MFVFNFDIFEQLFAYHSFRLFCLFVGVITIIILLIVVIRVLVSIYNFFNSPGFKWEGGPNTWAVVTGSTDGIGLAYAKQLYQKDYNLLLISRNPQKLEKVKQEIHRLFGNKRNIRVLAIDFSQSSDDIYDKIEKEFKKLEEIHVLVNNVGTNYPNGCPEYFTQIPNVSEVIKTLINVNIAPCTHITALVLPRMEAKGRGAIINVSSLTALFSTPMLSVYSATKIYVDHMSRSLQEEYRSRGITIQSLLPFYVSTCMTHNMKPRLYAPLPDTYVKDAIKTVGREERTAGYYFHELLGLTFNFLTIISNVIGIDFSAQFISKTLQGARNRIKAKQRLSSNCNGQMKRSPSNLDKLS